MKKILLLLFFMPFLASASFPVLQNYCDTIRKDGKVYIVIDKESSDTSFNKNSLNNMKEEKIIAQHSKINKSRNKNILGIFGSFGMILLILGGILGFLLLLFRRIFL